MTWSIADVIATRSGHVALAAGDLIMTGSPAGVGPVVQGQSYFIEINGLPDAELHYTL
jgi:fumarylpyruvate hydrolase